LDGSITALLLLAVAIPALTKINRLPFTMVQALVGIALSAFADHHPEAYGLFQQLV